MGCINWLLRARSLRRLLEAAEAALFVEYIVPLLDCCCNHSRYVNPLLFEVCEDMDLIFLYIRMLELYGLSEKIVLSNALWGSSHFPRKSAMHIAELWGFF